MTEQQTWCLALTGDFLCTHLHELHGDQFVAPLLEPGDDFTDKTAMHGIGLEHDESTFTVGHDFFRKLRKKCQERGDHATERGVPE